MAEPQLNSKYSIGGIRLKLLKDISHYKHVTPTTDSVIRSNTLEQLYHELFE